MIKANVILDNSNWKKKIKNPSNYFKNKLSKLSKISSFRRKNKITDVLSFPFNEKLKKNSFLGDIAISYEIVKKRSHNSSFAIELDKMWIHGLLHLLGYNHKKLKDYYKMRNKEKIILKHL